MSNSSQGAWPDDPNAPHVPYSIYLAEKANLDGCFVGAIFHGIVIVLFFQCMKALLNPPNRARDGIKWGLVAHTVAMFSLATMSIGTGLNAMSISYVDNREFPGLGDIVPGPLGYTDLPKFHSVNAISNSAVQLNQWLADGLLLYRCYIIYGMKFWVISFPFMVYVASWGTGITILYANSQSVGESPLLLDFGIVYFSIALALNVLLTLMIVTRLILHNANIRQFKALKGASGLYKVIITILVESCVLYAISIALFLGPWAGGSSVQLAFFQILPEVQVIAPFLIVLRVANQTALTSEAIVSGVVGSIRFVSQGDSSRGGDGTISDQNPVDLTSDAHGDTLGEYDTGAESAINVAL